MLPFTSEEFFSVFADYNAAVWTIVLGAYALGAFVVVVMSFPGRTSSLAIAAILAAMWGWTGVVYHWLYFSTINQAALLFGAAFLVQALIMFRAGRLGLLSFGYQGRVKSAVGLVLIIYTAGVYPLLGLAFSQAYPALPMFGVAPCPVTLFTLGCLSLTTQPVPGSLLIIPLAWSLIAGTAAFLLNVPQDWALLPSSVVVLALLKWPRRTNGITTHESKA